MGEGREVTSHDRGDFCPLRGRRGGSAGVGSPRRDSFPPWHHVSVWVNRGLPSKEAKSSTSNDLHRKDRIGILDTQQTSPKAQQKGLKTGQAVRGDPCPYRPVPQPLQLRLMPDSQPVTGESHFKVWMALKDALNNEHAFTPEWESAKRKLWAFEDRHLPDVKRRWEEMRRFKLNLPKQW